MWGGVLYLFLSSPKGFISIVNAPGFPGTQGSHLKLVYSSTCKPCKRKMKSKSQRGTKPLEAKLKDPRELNSRFAQQRG